MFPSAHDSSEWACKQNMEEQENILDVVQRTPTTSKRRLSTCLGVSLTHVWRTLREDGLYPKCIDFDGGIFEHLL
jgi:hypothetical protein